MNEASIFFVGKKRFEEYFIKPFNELIIDKLNTLDIANENDLFELDIEINNKVENQRQNSFEKGDSENEPIYPSELQLSLYKNSEQIIKITSSQPKFKDVYKVEKNVEILQISQNFKLFFYIIPSKLKYKSLEEEEKLNLQLPELKGIIKYVNELVNPGDPHRKNVRFDSTVSVSEHYESPYKSQIAKYESFNNKEKIINWTPIKNLIENEIISIDKVRNIFNEAQNENNNPDFPKDPQEIALIVLRKIESEIMSYFKDIETKGDSFVKANSSFLKENKLNVFVSDMKWCQVIAGYFLSSFCNKIDKVIVLPCLHEIVGKAGEFSSRNDERTNCREEKRDITLVKKIEDTNIRPTTSAIDNIKYKIKTNTLNVNDLKIYNEIAEEYKRFEDCTELGQCASKPINWRLYLDFYKYGYRDEIYWNQQFYSQKDRQFCRRNTFLGIFFNNLTYFNTQVNRIPETDEEVGGNKTKKRKNTKKNKRKTQKRKNKKTKSKKPQKSQKHKFSKRK